MRKETSGVDILLGLDGGELRVSSSILYLREGKDWWKTTRSMPTPIIERLRPMVGEYLKGGEGGGGPLLVPLLVLHCQREADNSRRRHLLAAAPAKCRGTQRQQDVTCLTVKCRGIKQQDVTYYSRQQQATSPACCCYCEM